jgi:hypothetical protein
MKYTAYKNFSINSQTEFEKHIICTNSERQFNFVEQKKTILDKYLYHIKEYSNKTSLSSIEDGDAIFLCKW